MKVGEYVRTTSGIERLKKENDNGWFFEKNMIIKPDNIEKYIIKSSSNIIDLIKEHDLLRLYDVEYGEEYITEVVIDSADILSVSNYDCDNFLHLVQELMTNEHIKLISIVTSEQFSQMEYRIGE